VLKTIPDLLESIPFTIRKLDAISACQECVDNNGLRIDVREPEEAANTPIKGSINIPRGLLEMRMLNEYPQADKAIYVHCATGARATLSAEQLMRIGYENVTVISCALDIIQNAAEAHA